jgi:hypothetical protein
MTLLALQEFFEGLESTTFVIDCEFRYILNSRLLEYCELWAVLSLERLISAEICDI